MIADVELKWPKDPGYIEYQKDEAELLREDIMGHVTAMVAEEIKEGSIGVLLSLQMNQQMDFTWSNGLGLLSKIKILVSCCVKTSTFIG